MSALRIVTPGPLTTVQDAGRYGYQALGVPVSGTLDPDARILANALVGNAPDLAVLECRLMGPSVTAEDGPVRLALAGAEATIKITRDDGSSETAPAFTSIDLAEGDNATIGPLQDSATGTLAVAGGVDVPIVFGSRSTLLRAAIGGLEGRALEAGDRLPVGGASRDGPSLALPTPPTLSQSVTLRIVRGPQDDYFSQQAHAALISAAWHVGQEADRMGIRLAGPRLEHTISDNIVSDAIATGAIQVPGSGQPILLLADHQTTGGYPKIACVVSADLSLAGRLGPGATVHFTAVETVEAEDIARAHAAELDALVASAIPVVSRRGSDPAALLSANLISGVTDGER